MTIRAKRYQNSAALLIFMRRTTISHFSFLISHSIEAFKRNQGASRLQGLTLSPSFFICIFPRSMLQYLHIPKDFDRK